VTVPVFEVRLTVPPVPPGGSFVGIIPVVAVIVVALTDKFAPVVTDNVPPLPGLC